ncbi:MAG: YraN family protein [Firmicutes bacterium]|nr:YraN family protein [Bacillota bacterium]
MNTKARGIDGENLAVKFLKKLGYYIEDRNYKTAIGEIDIVARDGSYLVFVEVKARKNNEFGLPCEFVTLPKIKRLSHTASAYINQFGLFESDVRFDIIEVYSDSGEINHIINAFESYF